MISLETNLQDGAASALKEHNPQLYRCIVDLIARGQTPKKIDRFIQRRFGLRQGHPVRDLCYMTALSLERKEKEPS